MMLVYLDCKYLTWAMCIELVSVIVRLTGGELFDRLVEQEYDLTEEDCITYMRQICQGVRHMHQQNLVHLDLKVSTIATSITYNVQHMLICIN